MTEKKNQTEPTEPTPTPGETFVNPGSPVTLPLHFGGKASIDLYSPVLDPEGKHLGVCRVIVSQEGETSGEALEKLMGQMGKYIDLGFTPLSPTNPKPVQATNGVQPSFPSAPGVPGVPTAPGVPGVPAGTPVPPTPEPESGTWDIARVDVTPLPEGFAKIEFYRTGQERPALKINKWKVEKIVEAFATGTGQPWTASHFQVANKYTLPLKVSWKLGRETGFGSARYRDVTGIAPG